MLVDLLTIPASSRSLKPGGELGASVMRLCYFWGAMAAVAAFASPSNAQEPLITALEAARAPAATSTRALFPGPAVTLAAPSTVDLARPITGAFRLALTFTPRNGATIKPSGVKLVYLKAPLVDLTPRVLPSISASGIDLRNVVLPPGEHHFRVMVVDSDGHLGSKTFTVLVAK